MNVEELNNERKRRKMSVADLAAKACLPKSTVEKILFGIVRFPRIDTLQAIERALEIEKNKQPIIKKESIVEEYTFMNIELWKTRKKELNITFDELAEITGISRRQLFYLFNGNAKNPGIETVNRIERALGIDKQKNAQPVIENELSVEDLEMYPVPLLGRVVAGIPVECQENIDGYVYINHRPKDEYFALRVFGDSMINAGVPDKAILIVHKQETAENGNIVVAFLNGEQTVKYFKIHGDEIYLVPANNNYLPIPVKETDDFLILGRVVEVRINL